MTSSTTASAPIGLIMIDTVNQVSPEEAEARHLKAECERVGTLDNLRRLLAGFRDKGFPAFLSPMSHTDEEYDTWKATVQDPRVMFGNRMFEAGGRQFHPDFQPSPGDVFVAPHKNLDVFATTDLDIQLSAAASSTWPWWA
ncbi:isochorismatase family protein (plasmid) [Streptomyces mirabilis]|uniref:Isochorismatase family protein n=1 Tax=Streptomyces mirabilis TaxID=68239 RepID=A0ABU3V5S7_9ACTN|nr:isochorismatase family protein [Streptomyces mirabilis]MCX5355717.1 isochorismatase family protein [Streptomyces mirabilis]MDU9001360.1 isochorismatase family protein [Streptomyces mirabilis]